MTQDDQEIVLPPVHEGRLDRAGLEQLFFDIEHGARFISARIKRAATQNSSETECSLASALEALDAGHAMAVQIHYHHQQRSWCDTILCHDGGYRVVRVDLDLVAEGMRR